VWTGPSGQLWIDAANALSQKTGVPITLVQIGPGAQIEDPYGTWANLAEIADGGVLLVRPDLYVAARRLGAPVSGQEAESWLKAAVEQVLGKQPTGA
jgi:2,4-dichlorophenol 6-monooxygenase